MQASVYTAIFLCSLITLCAGRIWEIDVPTSLQECYDKVRGADIETYVGSTYSWFCESAIKRSQMNGPATFDSQKLTYYNHLYERSVELAPVMSRGRRQFRHRGKRQSGQARCLRREYRMMSDVERNNFHAAVNALKEDTTVEPNKYDAIALLHTGMAAFTAHGGAGFPGWHRIYILMFETALREVDNSVCLPYWDSTMDSELEDPTLSPVWSNNFLGTAQGAVTEGPFAGWMTPEGGQLMRNAGSDGDPFTASAVEDILTRTSHADILTSEDTEPRYDLEFHHAAVHVFVGGTMGQLDTAAFDPIFFMHHSFVDYLWELFRTNLRSLGIDPETYPVVDDPESRHHSSAQTGFGNMTQADGYSDFLTESYEYEAAPICSNRFPECGSIYLTCFADIGRCVPIDPVINTPPVNNQPQPTLSPSQPSTNEPRHAPFNPRPTEQPGNNIQNPSQHFPNRPVNNQPNQQFPSQIFTNQPTEQPGNNIQNPSQHFPNRPVNNQPNQQFPSPIFTNQPSPNQPASNHHIPNQQIHNQQFPNQVFPNQHFPNRHPSQRPIQPIPNRPTPGRTFPNTSPNTNPIFSMIEPTFPNTGVCNKVTNNKRYGNPIQNNYCCNKNCDTNEWATIPVKIVSVRPPRFSTYSSYPVRNGRVMTNNDIYSPSAYSQTNRYITKRQANPKTFKRCGASDELVGQIFLTSKGINYDGYYKEASIVDNRLAVSISMGFINIKKPSFGGVTKALLRAHDSCGRVCHAACKDPKSGEYKACSGAVAINNQLPLMHGSTYDQAVMSVFDFQHNNDCPAFKTDNFFMTFYCDYHNHFPYVSKHAHGGKHAHKPKVVKPVPVVIPKSTKGCQVSKSCLLDFQCNAMKQCTGFSQMSACKGSCNQYAVCMYGRYFVKNCPEGQKFDDIQKSCVPGYCRNNKDSGRSVGQFTHTHPNSGITHTHGVPSTALNSRVLNSMNSNSGIINGNQVVVDTRVHDNNRGDSYRQRARLLNNYSRGNGHQGGRYRSAANTGRVRQVKSQDTAASTDGSQPYYSSLMTGYLKQFQNRFGRQ